MSLLLNLIGFFVFFTIFAYLPGFLILKHLKVRSFWDLNLAVGLLILGSALFFGRWLISANQVLLLIFTLSIVLGLKGNLFKIKLKKIKPNYKLLLVLFLGVTAQSIPYIVSLIKGDPQISYELFSSHDQAWHASLIYELINNFPPQIPGFSGVVLKNYHYLYDLILAANLNIFNLKMSHLLQGVYPIAISLLFGISIFRVTTFLTKNKLTPIFVVFFSYFVNNLSFLQQFLGKNDWHIYDLIIDQPIIYLFNHQTVLSIIITLYLLILLSKISLKKINLKLSLLISIGLTSLILLKIYAFIVIMVALAIYWMLDPKRKNLLLILFLSGLLSLAYLALTFNLGGKFIDFNPFWVAEAFFDKTLAPLLPRLHGLKMIWTQQGNLFKLFLLKILSAISLLLLSFHFRLLGFFRIFKKNNNSLFKLLIITSIVSILFTLVGNQSSSSFNIIQFTPYALTITTILALVTVEKFKPVAKYLVIALFFILSLPSLKPISSYLSHVATIKNMDKVFILQYLTNYPEGVIVSFIEGDDENNFLSSVSQKKSFFADQKQLKVLKIDYKERLQVIDRLNNNFCEFTDEDKAIINDNDIRYFLTAAQPCNDSSLTIIKSINQLTLYELKK